MMLPSGSFERAGDGQGDPAPAFRFGFELAAACAGELVVFGATVIFGLSPCGDEPAFLFHAVQGGEQRAGFYLEGALGDLLDPAGDAQAVHFSQGEGLQDHHVEGALEKVGLILGHVF